MNTRAKRLRRFTQGAHDFTWPELVAVLASLGFAETSDSGGSRRTFVSRYMMKQLIAALRSYGVAIKEHT
jgi:hypothetical protein